MADDCYSLVVTFPRFQPIRFECMSSCHLHSPLDHGKLHLSENVKSAGFADQRSWKLAEGVRASREVLQHSFGIGNKVVNIYFLEKIQKSVSFSSSFLLPLFFTILFYQFD